MHLREHLDGDGDENELLSQARPATYIADLVGDNNDLSGEYRRRLMDLANHELAAVSARHDLVEHLVQKEDNNAFEWLKSYLSSAIQISRNDEAIKVEIISATKMSPGTACDADEEKNKLLRHHFDLSCKASGDDHLLHLIVLLRWLLKAGSDQQHVDEIMAEAQAGTTFMDGWRPAPHSTPRDRIEDTANDVRDETKSSTFIGHGSVIQGDRSLHYRRRTYEEEKNLLRDNVIGDMIQKDMEFAVKCKYVAEQFVHLEDGTFQQQMEDSVPAMKWAGETRLVPGPTVGKTVESKGKTGSWSQIEMHDMATDMAYSAGEFPFDDGNGSRETKGDDSIQLAGQTGSHFVTTNPMFPIEEKKDDSAGKANAEKTELKA